MPRLNAIQLRDSQPSLEQLKDYHKTRRELYLILDSVQDTYNVGGLFRLADATGVSKIFLCGKTECPPNTRIHKSAVGLENWVKWEYHASAAELIKQVRSDFTRHCEEENLNFSKITRRRGNPVRTNPKSSEKNHVSVGTRRGAYLQSHPTIIAIEQSSGSIPLSKLPKLNQPIYLVLGHETHGVSKDVLQLCDHIVELPMQGINISLNVIIAAAVVIYHPKLTIPGNA